MIMLFTSIRPRECLGRAARHNGQFNPVAIEHPMVPEGLCHSFALRNSVRSADIARVVWFLTAPLLPMAETIWASDKSARTAAPRTPRCRAGEPAGWPERVAAALGEVAVWRYADSPGASGY